MTGPSHDDAEDPSLLAVADAIARGAPSTEDISVHDLDGPSNDVVAALAAVRQIVDAHREVSHRPPLDEPGPPRLALRMPPRWGHLTLQEAIGWGAFGVVFRAHDEQLRIDVALKLRQVSGSDSSPWVSALLDEAQRLARVRHPNVVRIYGADSIDGYVGIWMELVEGQTLEHMLGRGGPFGAREAALACRDVLHALAAVHKAGLVHGDIKAANVMRESGGRTVLMDFGASVENDAHSQHAGSVRGTPPYLAPEVFAGQPLSVSTDLYAVGVLLFHLATREYPIASTDPEELAASHRAGMRQRLRDLRPELPTAFVEVTERAIDSNPLRRYLSAGDLDAALTDVLALPRPAPRPSRLLQWHRPAIVMSALVLAIAGWSMLNTDSTRLATQPYEVEGGFYRTTAAGEEPLAVGSRLAVGDQLSFRMRASIRSYLYIVNEPDEGQAYLLFPLPGDSRHNPLPPDAEILVPENLRWQVTTPGGREHFVVFISPEPVPALEEAFRDLPSPGSTMPAANAVPLADGTAEGLRSVGGAVAVPRPPDDRPRTRFSDLFSTPLTGKRERTTGLWIRRLTVQNPMAGVR